MAQIGRNTEPRIKIGDPVAIMPSDIDPQGYDIAFGIVQRIQPPKSSYSASWVWVLKLTGDGGELIPPDQREAIKTLDTDLSVVPLELLRSAGALIADTP